MVTEIKAYQSKHINLINQPYQIKPYLKEIINNLEKSDAWKIELTIATDFISSKNTDEEHVMHSKGNHVMVIYAKTDEVIKDF